MVLLLIRDLYLSFAEFLESFIVDPVSWQYPEAKRIMNLRSAL